MKVILSVEAIRYPLTGVGRYNYELARHLPAVAEIDELLLFGGTGFVPDIPVAGESANASLTALRKSMQKSRTAVALRQILLDARRKKALGGHAGYVFHGPNFYLPPRDGPNVVTIHDLSIFTMPQCHPPERVRYMRKEIGRSLERAQLLITVSEYVRQETAAYFDWPLERVHAVSSASSGDFRPREPAELVPALGRLGLEAQGYCLFASTIEPRKNIARLLDAYGALPDALKLRFPLVLVGYSGWQSADIHARMAEAERQGWARYLGFVKDSDLPLIFAGARLFVMPSLYEGFGLPALEAMASGTPVVLADRASLPEIAADAALYVEPEDTDGLRAALEKGLEDEAWRRDARVRVLRQAALFSWQRCAEETAAAYRTAANL